MENKENLLGVLQTLFRWRKQIIRVCAVAAVVCLLIVLLMPNYYKSTTIFYAASPDLFKPEQVFGSSAKDMEYYGNSTDIDRILTIAQSNELVESLVKEFQLYQHYGIDSTNEKAPFRIRAAFLKLYEVTKTKHDAIEISVEDTDRQTAANMANAARNKINQMAQRLIKDSQAKLLQTFETNIEDKEKSLLLLGDSLIRVRQKYGIFDKTVGETLAASAAEAEGIVTRNRARLKVLEKEPSSPKIRDSISIIRANTRGAEEQLASLTSDSSKANFSLRRFNAGIATLDVLEKIHKEASSRLSYDQERYSQINAAYTANIPAIHLVEEARVPVVKSRPTRSLLVLATVCAAFFFSLIAVLLIESYQEVDWKKIRQPSK